MIEFVGSIGIWYAIGAGLFGIIAFLLHEFSHFIVFVLLGDKVTLKIERGALNIPNIRIMAREAVPKSHLIASTMAPAWLLIPSVIVAWEMSQYQAIHLGTAFVVIVYTLMAMPSLGDWYSAIMYDEKMAQAKLNDPNQGAI